ncbi:MAG: DUF1266 domain-containing protein [Candidatus Obscuribacterales bacterium]|nr:DUF1266 domain-containing protein [Candidatus Obscuribacterales bacterium]
MERLYNARYSSNPMWTVFLTLTAIGFSINCPCLAAVDHTSNTRIAAKQQVNGLSLAHRWALASTALLTENNGHSHDLLWCTEATTTNIATEKRMLYEWWGITSRADLLETLSTLMSAGTRSSFEEMVKLAPDSAAVAKAKDALNPKERAEFEDRLKIVREYGPKLGFKSLLGWDYARYIALCRWGTLCSYLSQEEAWSKIMPAARLLQNSFSSWADLGENYLIGRRFWLPQDKSNDNYKTIYSKLLSNPSSPWKTIPWSTDLSQK